MIMPETKLADEHRVVRQVPFSKQIRDEANQLLGVRYDAFLLREGEKYLSVAWCEYFNDDPEAQAIKAIGQLRASRSDRKSTAYWISSVGSIRGVLAPHAIRAIHEPLDGFECHAALRRWPEEAELLEKLALEAAADFVISGDAFP